MHSAVELLRLNRELIEWAVENLLSNALSALDRRPGVIEVAVERRGATEEVEIVVSDNGRGMTRDEQKRVFDPGYSTKRSMLNAVQKGASLSAFYGKEIEQTTWANAIETGSATALMNRLTGKRASNSTGSNTPNQKMINDT